MLCVRFPQNLTHVPLKMEGVPQMQTAQKHRLVKGAVHVMLASLVMGLCVLVKE